MVTFPFRSQINSGASNMALSGRCAFLGKKTPAPCRSLFGRAPESRIFGRMAWWKKPCAVSKSSRSSLQSTVAGERWTHSAFVPSSQNTSAGWRVQSTQNQKNTHKSQATFTDTLSASKKQQQNAIFCATIHISYHLGVGSLPGNSGHQDIYICLGDRKNRLEFSFNSKLQRYDPTTAQRVHPLSQELSHVVDLIKGELGQHVDAAFCRRSEMMTISWRVTEVMMNCTEMVGYFLMSYGVLLFWITPMSAVFWCCEGGGLHVGFLGVGWTTRSSFPSFWANTKNPWNHHLYSSFVYPYITTLMLENLYSHIFHKIPSNPPNSCSPKVH